GAGARGTGAAEAAGGQADGGQNGDRRGARGPGARAPHSDSSLACWAGARGARRAPRAPVNQPLPQAGLGLTIATEPVAVVGSTWTNFAPVCHWKMKCAA